MSLFVKKTINVLLRFSVLFIVAEVIWMLLPFAGFLYGSVFHMQYLSRNPHTAWLAHFVFPVHTLFPLGIILMSAGFIIFLIGASQIYSAKFRKSGLVTSGLYAKIRHPQYIALILFGMGTLLTWGRFITFLAFFVMLLLYYYLALSEEGNCERLFGKTYDNYKAKTYFLFPGEAWIADAWKRSPTSGWPKWISVPLHLVLVVLLAFAVGHFIQFMKVKYQQIPFITAEIELPSDAAASSPHIPFIESENGRLVLIQGPSSMVQKEAAARHVLGVVTNSETLREELAFLSISPEDRAVILVGDPAGPPRTMPGRKAKLELFVVRVRPNERGVDTLELVTDPNKRTLVSAISATVDLGIPQGQDAVIAYRDHPSARIVSRWQGMMEAVKGRIKGLGGGAEDRPGKLILVQAPLVRARDEAFARQILKRLLRSDTVKRMLAEYQVGGNVLAVAFPRPGPNWYREHHGIPQIGAFVMIVRRDEALPESQLFRPDSKTARTLEAAFVVEMDFARQPPEDPVYEKPFVVGPLRDLEERWDFFLSGVR
jgi:protein-S-isoprenylcysteine O-methyltransferase Ste14